MRSKSKMHIIAAKARKKGKKKLARVSKSKRRFGKESLTSHGIVLPKRLPVEPRKVVVVYGMRIEPGNITRAAIEAYNKRKYTVHDVRLTEHIADPKFRNLMVKIAILDRIEEEIHRLYPDVDVLRPNTVTLIVR